MLYVVKEPIQNQNVILNVVESLQYIFANSFGDFLFNTNEENKRLKCKIYKSSRACNTGQY